MGGAHTSRRGRGGRKGRPRSNTALHAASNASGGQDMPPGPGGIAAGKQAQMVFTVGTFEDDDGA
ncbi:hypothetical protein H4R19_006834, partial [Coemansia spiralis]